MDRVKQQQQRFTGMKWAWVVFLLVITFSIVVLAFWSAAEIPDIALTKSQLANMPHSPEKPDLHRIGVSHFSRDVVNTDSKTRSKASHDLPQEASIWEQLREGDYWSLISEHWPRANNGDADSQLIVHKIMSFCAPYKRRFEGKDLAEVQAEFAGSNDPNLFILNANVWNRCGRIYESWHRFSGWEGMREAAAYIGQPAAMVWKGGTLISDPETFDEGIRWLESALASGDGSALVMMGNLYSKARVDEKLAAAWLLAACKRGFDCSIVAESCGVYTDCGVQERVRDVIIRELGDGGYYVANQKAERIYQAIASGNIASLDIAADLRK